MEFVKERAQLSFFLGSVTVKVPALSRYAFDLDGAAHGQRDMLDDTEPQARATHLPAAAPVHPVKALKEPR